MTYLQLVQAAIKRSGAREELPSTTVGATGIVADFCTWVADSWEELQLKHEDPPWFWKLHVDQTIALVAGTDNYNLHADHETVWWPTTTVYTVAKTDEVPLKFIEYFYWRSVYDTRTGAQQRPQYITQAPSGVLYVYPVPDQTYTLRFDAVNDLHLFVADATVPESLPEKYHQYLVWDAVARYASHHEDGAKLADATAKTKPYLKRLVNQQVKFIELNSGHLRGKPKSSIY